MFNRSKYILPILASALVMGSCVNGKVEKGTLVNVDTLSPRDSVSTVSANSNGFMIVENMQSASFNKFFKAEVDENGHVSCLFSNVDDPNFAGLFNAEKCPKEEISILNAEGRCCGIAILNEGGGVDPYLLMLMEDDHAERISLFDISEGMVRSTQRTAQEGIVKFDLGESTDEGAPIVGVAIDGSKISLDWEAL